MNKNWEKSHNIRTNYRTKSLERPSGTALYLQVPFCPERCDYCSIPVSSSQNLVFDYLNALEREIERTRPYLATHPPITLYIGGGSPTSLSPDAFDHLVRILYPMMTRVEEVTFESRPEAMTEDLLKKLSKIPRLRLSIGMEAIDRQSLDNLGRKAPLASPVPFLERIRASLDAALSMDFIINGTGFDPELFLSICHELKEKGLDHLSVYPLVIEERTVLSLRKSQGKTEERLEEAAAENWRICCKGLKDQGWTRYEVSNFSRDHDSVCRHNLHVWQGGETMGLGPGAHQTLGSVRYENVRSVSEYIRISGGEDRHPYVYRGALTRSEENVESLYTNLRLGTGIPVRWILDRTGEKEGWGLIDKFVRNNVAILYRTNEDFLTLTDEGLFLLDGIASSFIDLFKEDLPAFGEVYAPEN